MLTWPCFTQLNANEISIPENSPQEVFPTEDFLLVNLKSTKFVYILKSSKLVRMGGEAFIQGVIADIGDDASGIGIKTFLAMSDVVSIRAFTYNEAEAYWGASFRESLN